MDISGSITELPEYVRAKLLVEWGEVLCSAITEEVWVSNLRMLYIGLFAPHG